MGLLFSQGKGITYLLRDYIRVLRQVVTENPC